MDEFEKLKEIKKKIRETCKTNFILFLIVWPLSIILAFVDDLINGKDSSGLMLSAVYIAAGFLLFVFVMIIPHLGSYLKTKNEIKNKKRFDKTSMKNIVRKMPEVYSPAICSYLYNNKIEAYTDYTATVLNLEQKGFIRINLLNGQYSVEFLNNDLEKLNRHEKYVLDCLKRKNNFYGQKFKKNVMQDMAELDLIRLKKKYLDFIIAIISIPFIFLFNYALAEKVVHFLYMGLYIKVRIIIIIQIAVLIGGIIFYLKKITKYIFLTKKGKEIKKQVEGFKAFFDQYTLMDDRSINHKELLGNYVAYAISLGETETINKFIEQNEQYRDFIYMKKIKFINRV